MKRIFVSLVFVCMAYCSFAQWTPSGTNIYYNDGNVGIGTTSPLTRLHIVGNGASIDGGNAFLINGDAMAIQANTGGRSTTTGAQLEFVIPANTDGTNLYGQARIITIAGNANTFDATGKMILGTRRLFNKLGTGSQWYYGNDITIDGTGNVGVGTTSPQNKFVVSNGTAGLEINPSASISSATGTYVASYNRSASAYADIIFDQGGSYTVLKAGGNVGINTTDTKGYMLAVNGTAIATAMIVKLNANWPDYVFKPQYHLPSLAEVKTYIDQNQHLPDMPSEAEVTKNGINLGEMDKLLTKKVEELTLYLIEKNNNINSLEKTVDNQQQQINQQQMTIDVQTSVSQTLQKEIDELKQQLLSLKQSK